jgi:three-Cys-motif partner protein
VTLVPASDGVLAREVQSWSDEKLHYVERYMDIFTTAMRDKWRLVYVDILSGPGMCVDERSRVETEGSPLRALHFESFDHLYFNDLDPLAVAALRQRIPAAESQRVTISQLDCNEAGIEARRVVFAERPRSTLGLAFIDPEGFEVSFDAVRDLTAGVRLDLIITFMTGYIRRFRDQSGFAEAVDRFVGSREWRTASTTRQLLDVYEEQLRRIGYTEVDDDVRIVNSRESTLYHLIFASRHPRGREFFNRIAQRTYRGQRRLFD